MRGSRPRLARDDGTPLSLMLSPLVSGVVGSTAHPQVMQFADVWVVGREHLQG